MVPIHGHTHDHTCAQPHVLKTATTTHIDTQTHILIHKHGSPVRVKASGHEVTVHD